MLADLAAHRLPDRATAPAAVAAASLALVAGGSGLLLQAAACGAGAVLVLALLQEATGGGLGTGDVKLAGVIGLALGQAGPRRGHAPRRRRGDRPARRRPRSGVDGRPVRPVARAGRAPRGGRSQYARVSVRTTPADGCLCAEALARPQAYGGGSVQDPGIDVLTSQRKRRWHRDRSHCCRTRPACSSPRPRARWSRSTGRCCSRST
nr:A24 family peptidase [Clavibacter michiganensis]